MNRNILLLVALSVLTAVELTEKNPWCGRTSDSEFGISKFSHDGFELPFENETAALDGYGMKWSNLRCPVGESSFGIYPAIMLRYCPVRPMPDSEKCKRPSDAFDRIAEGTSLINGEIVQSDFRSDVPSADLPPVLHIFYVRYVYNTDLFTASFNILKGANLRFIIAPKKKVHFSGDLRMNKLDDIGDLKFDCYLGYSFSSSYCVSRSPADLAVGLRNTARKTVQYAGMNNPEIRLYSLYSSLNFSVLKATMEYAFASTKISQNSLKANSNMNLSIMVEHKY